jgi:hypothetical protein
MSATATTATLQCVRIAAGQRATKRYFLDRAGKLANEAAVQPWSGWYHRVRLPLAAPLAALAKLLTKLGSTECIATGTATFAGDKAPLTTQNARAKGAPGVTRTKGWAVNRPGVPALLCFDFDLKDLPDALRQRVDQLTGGAWAVSAMECPALHACGHLLRPSCSIGVNNTKTGEQTPGGGLHAYVVVADGSDSLGFVRRLHERLVLAGWGFVFVTKAGQPRVRSPIDVDASGDPERIVFEADAKLDHPDLAHRKNARVQVVEHDGTLLDTSALPDLTPDERRRLADIKRDLIADPVVQQLVRDSKDRWIQEQADRLVRQGMAPDAAKVAATRAARSADMGLLDPDLEVRLDRADGTQEPVSCWDMLDDPAAYDGRTGSDPLEPDYHGGRNLAVWWLEENVLRCFSQAHGGQTFTLAYPVSCIIETWQAEPDKDDPATLTWLRDLWGRTRWSSDPAEAQREYEQVVAARVPLSGGLDFGRDSLAGVETWVKDRDVEALRGLHTTLGTIFDEWVNGLYGVGLIAEPLATIERWLNSGINTLADRLSAGTWLSRLVQPPDRLLGDLVTTTIRAFIVGRTGLGKTLLGFAFAIAMARGQDFLHWRAGRAARVLYIDGEMAAELLQERLRDATGGTPVSGLFLFSLEDAEEIAEAWPAIGAFEMLNTLKGHQFIQRLCEELKPDVVVFDNVQALLQGVQKEEETWIGALPLVRWLTKRRIGQLWFDHTGHNAIHQYGTARKAWQFDTVGIMAPLEDVPLDETAFTLSFDHPGKARRRTPANWQEFAPVVIRLKNGTWSHESPANGKASGTGKLGKVKPGLRVFHKALLGAIAKVNTGPSETTLDAWEDECVRTGLLDPFEQGDDHKVRASKRAMLRNAKLALVQAEAIEIDGDRVRDRTWEDAR